MIGSCTSHREMLQILPCEMLKGNTLQQNSSTTKRTQNMRGKQLTRLIYQRKQSHQLVNWLMFLMIILPMFVLNLLKKLNTNTTVAFEISFLNMNKLRDLFSNL